MSDLAQAARRQRLWTWKSSTVMRGARQGLLEMLQDVVFQLCSVLVSMSATQLCCLLASHVFSSLLQDSLHLQSGGQSASHLWLLCLKSEANREREFTPVIVPLAPLAPLAPLKYQGRNP